MRKYLLPLEIFVVGQLIALGVFLFLPAIGTASSELASATSAMASTFWGWTWVVSATRLLVVISLELVILWGTAKAFLGLRH